jgi:hypothetical protein
MAIPNGQTLRRGCAKSTNRKPYDLLQPLEVPSERWQRVNVDFITMLTASEGKDTIITFVVALTKQAIWTATTEGTDRPTVR